MGRKNKKNQRQSNSRSLKDGKKEKEANENLLQSPTIETRETNNLDFIKDIFP